MEFSPVDSNGRVFTFESGNVDRMKENQSFIMHFDKQFLYLADSQKEVIPHFSVDQFQAVRIHNVTTKNQSRIRIDFSDPLLAKQDFRSLIKVAGIPNSRLKFRYFGNSVYLTEATCGSNADCSFPSGICQSGGCLCDGQHTGTTCADLTSGILHTLLQGGFWGVCVLSLFGIC